MKIIYKLIFFFLIFINTSYAELIRPNSNLKPLDVLMIQLNSLKNNNNPYKDAGIEQTWEFAHPNNKIYTGPLKKFKKMLYSDNYKILISHKNTKTKIVQESPNKFVFKVNVLSKDKKKYYYIWQIEKVKREGKLKDCWMTTGVSDPIYLGETI